MQRTPLSFCRPASAKNIFFKEVSSKRESLFKEYSWIIAHGIRTLPLSSGKGFLCQYSNYFNELANANVVEWRPTIDNLLLVFSIALAYVAGITTPATSSASKISNVISYPKLVELQKLPDEQNEKNLKENPSWTENLWSGLYSKITGSRSLTDEMCVEITSQGGQLNLQALARDARSRLLLVSFEQLKKEVCKLQQSKISLESGWSEVSVQMLCESVILVCRDWMHEEYLQGYPNKSGSQEFLATLFPSQKTKFKSSEMVIDDLKWELLFNSYSEDYEAKKMMIQMVKVTGKAEFYADFLYFVCTGSVRESSCCKLETLQIRQNCILEDIVILIADGAAALYLDMITDAAPICEGQWSKVMAPMISSTRMLQQFRNEVALNSWLKENFQSVASMFEDRYDLWVFKPSILSADDGKDSTSKNKQKDSFRDSARNTMTHPRKQSELIVIEQSKLPVKRIKELRALTGWRYYYSLYLEFSDICGPILRTITVKLGQGISFLLVFLIGRSLGLIYRGIRQSVQWTSK